MIGKRVALLQVPNQALFSLKAAAQFLGISIDALREDTDMGLIPCYEFHSRRTYKLEDLETLRSMLPRWQNERRPIPASSERIIDGE
jgi:DNA-binding transcriptional MerR regulator